MRKILLLGAVIAALAFAGLAAAGNGNTNGNTTKSANGAQTAHFVASYESRIGGHANCHGERVAKPGANGFVKDEEECTFSDAASFFPAGTATGDPYVVLNDHKYYWSSDYDNQIAKQVTYIVSPALPDGSAHVKVIAVY